MTRTPWIALAGLVAALAWAGCPGSIVQPDDDDDAADDDAADDDAADDDAGDDDAADDDAADDDAGDDDTGNSCSWEGAYSGDATIEGSDPVSGEAWSFNAPAWAAIDGQCQVAGEIEVPGPGPTSMPLAIEGHAANNGNANGQITGALSGIPSITLNWSGHADGVELYGEWSDLVGNGSQLEGHFQLWIEEDLPSDSGE